MSTEVCPICKGKRFQNRIIGRKLQQVDCPTCSGTGEVFVPDPIEQKVVYRTWVCNFCEGKFKADVHQTPGVSRCPYCGSTSEIDPL
jgi:DnaJ-class molecular chaperone